jgi:NADPH-dependent ferric siderophore reductase
MQRPARTPRPPRLVRVEDVRPLSAGMVRIVFGGEGLDDFEAGAFTDHYVKLQLPPAGAAYRAPFDPAQVRTSVPREHWPRTRTYTVRHWDPERRRLTIDFVVHGEGGIAGPWAAAAAIGDLIQLSGPGGAYAPDPEVDWHLLVGDESAAPAIAAALERVPANRAAHVILQVSGPDHAIALTSPGAFRVEWLYGEDDDAVLDAVRALDFPGDGVIQAFVHGEASMVRAVRRHLLTERDLPATMLSASGYWKRDRTEEGWREDKSEWNRLVQADAPA